MSQAAAKAALAAKRAAAKKARLGNYEEQLDEIFSYIDSLKEDKDLGQWPGVSDIGLATASFGSWVPGAATLVDPLSSKQVANMPTTYLEVEGCLLYTSPSPRDRQKSRMPSSA